MKKQKLPTIVVIAILTLITTLLWAFFDITRAFLKKPDIKVEASTIVPIDPSLDLETLNLLQSATFFEEGQVAEIVIPSASPTAEPIIEPSPETTIEIVEDVTPSASPSAQTEQETVQ